ncbi:hypothetical protein DL770_009372 [Monosporascus sp. CRB-9-2]|nr:hypothetical protein DL770_009372 [Monosporascus sp. CRB-9-2]
MHFTSHIISTLAAASPLVSPASSLKGYTVPTVASRGAKTIDGTDMILTGISQVSKQLEAMNNVVLDNYLSVMGKRSELNIPGIPVRKYAPQHPDRQANDVPSST